MEFYYFNGMAYDRPTAMYHFRLVSSDGVRTEVPLQVGSSLDFSMGEGRRCLGIKNDGEFCLAPIGGRDRLCASCKTREDTCMYGIGKLQWEVCPDSPLHVCPDRNNFTNYLASYGIRQVGNSFDIKSGISISPPGRLRRGGYAFAALLKPALNTDAALPGSLLPVAALHEAMIPAIAALRKLPVPSTAERFSWSNSLQKMLTNTNFLDETAYERFSLQVQNLMEAIYQHCDRLLAQPEAEMWKDLQNLLSSPSVTNTSDRKDLYERVRTSPIFSGKSELLSVTIRDVYSSLRCKEPAVKRAIYEAIPGTPYRLIKAASSRGPEGVVVRVRNKPVEVHVKGDIAMVRGDSIVIVEREASKIQLYKLERLSRGRPLVLYKNLPGVHLTNSGSLVAQTGLEQYR